MIERFKGKEGKRKLIDALLGQKCVHRTPEMSDELADLVTLKELKVNDVLIQQDAEDTDMYFILAGKVKVVVKDRLLAERTAGEHVGEMALIDPKAKRSASVIATETVVVAAITEPDFTTIAAKFPTLWRYLALELADRLRQRNQHVRPPNAKPQLFIGSSVEALPVAREIQGALTYDCVPRVWTDGVFGASKATIHDLMVQVEKSDFAVMVFTPDDKVLYRSTTTDAPRDNVVFELGLFMGDVGPDRAFIVKPRGATMRVPTDLLGIKTLEYDPSDPKDFATAVAPAANEIRKRIKELGPK